MSAAPATRTFVATRAGLLAAPRSRSRAFSGFAVRAALFGCIVMATHITASLCGYVLLESARREGIQADLRAKAARRAEAAIRRSVDALNSVNAIQEWALANGFVATDTSVRPSLGVTRVASRLE